MPPIEIRATRPVGAVQIRTIGAETGQQMGPVKTEGQPGAATGAPKVERSPALDPGAPPVDAERVAVIRRAVRDGSYPVIPTKIADAMIAAEMLLRNPR